MDINEEVIDWLYGIMLMLMSALGYFSARTLKRIEDEQEKHKTSLHLHEKEFLGFKLHVSENYTSKAEMINTLARIHDRIDEMSSDVKTLIRGQK